jgi:amino acid adenylation domain-containing protein
VQIIAPHLDVRINVHDLRRVVGRAQELEAQHVASFEAQLPFDLEQGPLIRVALIRLGELDQLLVLTMHHIICDGWSMGVVLRDLAALYASASTGRPSELPSLPIQYADFAVWQRGWLVGEVLDEQLGYWRTQLAGAPAVLELPTDRRRPVVQTYRGATCPVRLGAHVTRGLKQLAQAEGATLFMVLLAGFQAVLHRYTGQTDVVVGTPIANRTRSELEHLVGFFVNSLVLRTDLAGDPSFRQLVRRVREVMLGAYAHQDLPFEKLVEELQPERNLSHNPLFQVMFVLQNAPATTASAAARSQPDAGWLPILATDTAKFDLTWSIAEGLDQSLVGALEYNADLFDHDTIARLSGHLTTLLTGVMADAEQAISRLPLLSATERRQLVVDWNATDAAYASEATLHAVFAQQVERSPEALAVVFGQWTLTYRQLEERANQLAHHLRHLGVEPETRVGVCIERSIDLVVALLGVLKAGGAYVPLDPDYPRERLAYMLSDADARVLLTQSHLLGGVPEHTAHTVCVDGDAPRIRAWPTTPPTELASSRHLAYVMYTSGSTGNPKGVAVEHQALVNHMAWLQWQLALSADDRVLQKTAISFDVSAWEVFWPLLTGATLVVAEPGRHQDTSYLVETIAAHRITTIYFVASMLQVFLEEPRLDRCWSLRQLFCGGEAMPDGLAERVADRLDVQLHNIYGPTEAAIDATSWTSVRGTCQDPAPIGRPIANTRVYVVDAHDELVPIGVPGELLIGGVGLARGYLDRPEMTAERFVPDVFSGRPGARLYRTGDLVRWRADGLLEFLGRLDHQVKLRGYRIELGEIEFHLSQHADIREAVVIMRDQRLLAYVVAREATRPATPLELRAWLAQRVPEYMLPSLFIELDSLPRMPNGKLDRGSLPTPDTTRPVQPQAFEPATTPLQQTLVTIWSEVLHIDSIGIHDNFFDLGGHSLLATQVVSRIRDALHLELPLRTFFESPTIAHLAAWLSIRVTSEDSCSQASIAPVAREVYRATRP